MFATAAATAALPPSTSTTGTTRGPPPPPPRRSPAFPPTLSSFASPNQRVLRLATLAISLSLSLVSPPRSFSRFLSLSLALLSSRPLGTRRVGLNPLFARHPIVHPRHPAQPDARRFPGPGVGRFCPVWRKPPPLFLGLCPVFASSCVLANVLCTRRLVRTTHPPVRGSSPVHLQHDRSPALLPHSCLSSFPLFPPSITPQKRNTLVLPRTSIPLPYQTVSTVRPSRVYARRLSHLLLAPARRGFSVSVVWSARLSSSTRRRRVLDTQPSGRRTRIAAYPAPTAGNVIEVRWWFSSPSS